MELYKNSVQLWLLLTDHTRMIILQISLPPQRETTNSQPPFVKLHKELKVNSALPLQVHPICLYFKVWD